MKFVKEVLLNTDINLTNLHNWKMSEMFVGWLLRTEEYILQTFKTNYVNDNVSIKVVDDNEEVNKVNKNTPMKVKDEELNGVISSKLKDKPKVIDYNKYDTKVSSSYERHRLNDCKRSYIKVNKYG